MTKWHPIETAPKDGAWLALNGGELENQRWWGADGEEDENQGRRPVVAKWVNKGDEDRYQSGWFVCDFDDGYGLGIYYDNPTHWMPLQAPPVADGEEPSR